MKRKAVSVLLIGALALWLFGCREEEPGKVGEANAPGTRQRETAREGTTTRPAQPTQPGQPAQPTQPTQPGRPGAAGTAQETLNQQRNEYVQGAEQILNNMEQKFTAWQQQAGAQAQQDPKVQELSKQVQTEIADARAAVDNMRNATGTQLKDAKVAADQAIKDAEAAFKNLVSSQTQVTQAQ